MNWGNRVIIILGVFLTGMISMVYLSMRQTNEVVETNYYEQEMKYQQVIDGKRNLLELNDSVRMENDGRVIKISLPQVSVNQLDSGYIEFLKLSDSKDDKLIPMSSTKSNLYEIPSASFRKGFYKVRIDWHNAGKSYYHEQDFNIQ